MKIIHNDVYEVSYRSDLFEGKTEKEIESILSKSDEWFILYGEMISLDPDCSFATVLKTCKKLPDIQVGDEVCYNHTLQHFKKIESSIIIDDNETFCLPHYFIYRDSASAKVSERYLQRLNYHSHDSTTEIDINTDISVVNELEKITSMVFDLYKANSKWFKRKLIDINAEIKFNEKVKLRYPNKSDRKMVYSALSFFDDLSKKTSYKDAYEISSKTYNISIKELRSLIGSRNAFRKIKFS